MIKEKKQVIDYCLTYQNVYEDYPFSDPDPQWREFWRNTFKSVIPAYHLNKTHWNSVILDGTIPDKDIERMIGESYDLTGKKIKKS